jgi:diadenylate cyclase
LLDKNLGTRHRAAMGLTEETDALAVVISEERGEISLALRGTIQRHLTPDDLKVRLRAAMLKRRWTPGEPSPATEEARG